MLNHIGPHGVKQCVVGPTRQGRVGQTDSGLDHFWSNTPGKMSTIYTKYSGSDHKVIMGVRYAKVIKSSTRYGKKRSYKRFVTPAGRMCTRPQTLVKLSNSSSNSWLKTPCRQTHSQPVNPTCSISLLATCNPLLSDWAGHFPPNYWVIWFLDFKLYVILL